MRKHTTLIALGLAASIAGLAACKRDEASAPAAAPAAEAPVANAVTAVVDHSSPAGDNPAFDTKAFAGTYAGLLPCADCPGTDTTLAFTPEGKYTLTEVYKDKGAASFVSEGTWNLEKDGTTLHLDPNDKDEYDHWYTIVSPTELRALDKDGKPIQSTLNYNLQRR